MELRLLRYFVAVAEELNVTRAAERLHTAQPSLSQQIRHLEDMIGAPLFHRRKHHLELTEAGRALLEDSRRILNDTERVLTRARQIGRTEAGAIIIAMVPGPEGKMFTQILPALLREHPDIKLTLRSLTSPEQILALCHREINLGFLRGPINDDEIASEVVLREDVVAVLPARHPLAARKRIAVADLTELPLVQMSRAIAPRYPRYDEQHRRVGWSSVSSLVRDREHYDSVERGFSWPRFHPISAYVEGILPKNVVVRPLALRPTPQHELLIAYRKDDTLPALAYFLGMLRKSQVVIGGIYDLLLIIQKALFKQETPREPCTAWTSRSKVL